MENLVMVMIMKLPRLVSEMMLMINTQQPFLGSGLRLMKLIA